MPIMNTHMYVCSTYYVPYTLNDTLLLTYCMRYTNGEMHSIIFYFILFGGVLSSHPGT